jgi:hypothetical protein
MNEEELRAQVEGSLLFELIVSKEVREKITVSGDDLRKEYEQRKNRYVTAEKVAVTDVVLFLDRDDHASKEKALGILSRINAAVERNPWNLVADGTFLVRTLEVQKEKEPELYAAAKKLGQGELSGVIAGTDSLHIIQLTSYTPGRQKTFEEVKESLEGTLRTAAHRKRLQEWERELKKRAVIVVMDSEKPNE